MTLAVRKRASDSWGKLLVAYFRRRVDRLPTRMRTMPDSQQLHVPVRQEDDSLWATVDEFLGVFGTGDDLRVRRPTCRHLARRRPRHVPAVSPAAVAPRRRKIARSGVSWRASFGPTGAAWCVRETAAVSAEGSGRRRFLEPLLDLSRRARGQHLQSPHGESGSEASPLHSQSRPTDPRERQSQGWS
jgi:hypothetical protein